MKNEAVWLLFEYIGGGGFYYCSNCGCKPLGGAPAITECPECHAHMLSKTEQEGRRAAYENGQKEKEMNQKAYHITITERDNENRVEMDTNAFLLGVSVSADVNKGGYYVSDTCPSVEEEVLNMIQGVFYALNERMRTVDPLTAQYLMALVHQAAAGEGFDVNPI